MGKPTLVLNNDAIFHIKSFDMMLDPDGEVVLVALSTDPIIDVFTAMRRFSPHNNPSSGELIISIKVYDAEEDLLYSDTTHNFAYDAVYVSFFDTNSNNESPKPTYEENRGFAQIRLCLLEQNNV